MVPPGPHTGIADLIYTVPLTTWLLASLYGQIPMETGEADCEGCRADRPRTIELVDTDVPPVGPGQARLRILQCGVCTSELDPLDGPGSGRAAHADRARDRRVGRGDRARGVESHTRAAGPGGGFAEQAVVEERFCVPVAPHVTYPAVAEPLACAVNAVELAEPALADDVVILGAGFMDTLVQMVTGLKGLARSPRPT